MATPILMPRQGQSVESCILVEWLVKAGDTVTEGQPVANIETDKATFEVESPAAGVVIELFFDEGEDIPVLTNIAAVGAEGEDVADLKPGGSSAAAPAAETAPPAPAVEPAPEPQPAPAPSVSSAGTAVGISPRARKLAEEKGVPIAGLTGSGPGGRIIERDVAAAAAGRAPLTPAARDAAASGLAAPASGSGIGGRILSSDMGKGAAPAMTAGETREIPVKGIRKIIAQKMQASLHSTAQLTITRSFDASTLQSFRARAKTLGEEFGLPKVTVNDLITYAAVQTLRKHPALNAHFLGDKIIEHGEIHVGIAVDTPRGLMVPVLKNAHAMSLGDMARAIRPLATSCQEGSVNPDLLSGGTFTITNLGALGVETFTPVLNPPEVAILGVGGLTLKPVRKDDGSVRFVDAIPLSLTIDHQAVDGAPAARFLQDLCIALENIDLLLSR